MNQSQARYTLVQTLTTQLIESEANHLLRMEDELLQAHKKTFPEDSGFLVDGVKYTAGKSTHFSEPMHLLPDALRAHGTMLQEAYKQLQEDKAFITQGLTTLLRKCTSMQEIRDALPDAVVNHCTVKGLQCPRVQEEGWTMKDNDLHGRHFDRLKTRLLTHISNRMLY